MQVQVKQNGRIAKALVWLCCAAPCIGCSTDQSADTVPASDAAMPDAGHAEDAPNNSQDAQGTDHGGTGDTPQEDCPDGHVCGSGDTVACQGPVEFAADPQDEACTPAAHLPTAHQAARARSVTLGQKCVPLN